jgi:hypothetical protein
MDAGTKSGYKAKNIGIISKKLDYTIINNINKY